MSRPSGSEQTAGESSPVQSAQDTPEAPGLSADRKCEFCGCNTNAKLRRCCPRGQAADTEPSAASGGRYCEGKCAACGGVVRHHCHGTGTAAEPEHENLAETRARHERERFAQMTKQAAPEPSEDMLDAMTGTPPLKAAAEAKGQQCELPDTCARGLHDFLPVMPDGECWRCRDCGTSWESDGTPDQQPARVIADCPECKGDGALDGDDCHFCGGSGEVYAEPQPPREEGEKTMRECLSAGVLIERVARLREGLRSCVSALHNGSAISPLASDDFHMDVPREVGMYCRRIEAERDSALADRQRAEKALEEMGRELAKAQANNHKRNVELDALHFVWCDGGCESGVHRFGEHPPLTAEIVAAAERNALRLRRWYVARVGKGAEPSLEERRPLWVSAHNEINEAHAQRADAAEAERDAMAGVVEAARRVHGPCDRCDSAAHAPFRKLVEALGLLLKLDAGRGERSLPMDDVTDSTCRYCGAADCVYGNVEDEGKHWRSLVAELRATCDRLQRAVDLRDEQLTRVLRERDEANLTRNMLRAGVGAAVAEAKRSSARDDLTLGRLLAALDALLAEKPRGA